MKFIKKDATSFTFDAIQAIAYSGMESLSADISVLTVRGSRGLTKSMTSDRFFFLLDGSGIFTVALANYDVAQEDVIFVPKNTPFTYGGTMRMIEFSTPPFDAAGEVDLEGSGS